MITNYAQVTGPETAHAFIALACDKAGFDADSLSKHAIYWWESDFANLVQIFGDEDAMRNKIGASWVLLYLSGKL